MSRKTDMEVTVLLLAKRIGHLEAQLVYSGALEFQPYHAGETREVRPGEMITRCEQRINALADHLGIGFKLVPPCGGYIKIYETDKHSTLADMAKETK